MGKNLILGDAYIGIDIQFTAHHMLPAATRDEEFFRGMQQVSLEKLSHDIKDDPIIQDRILELMKTELLLAGITDVSQVKWK